LARERAEIHCRAAFARPGVPLPRWWAAARESRPASSCRRVPHLAFADSEPCEHTLRIDLNPDRKSLSLNVNSPGKPFGLDRAAAAS
jgi:hypothetical protein